MKLSKYLPILDWLPKYKKSYLNGDLSAGLTVGIMFIPQGMAYAMIAGLPPVYGLYAAIIPQVIYSFFGTSRQLSVGPVAMDSLLVAAGVSAFAVAGSENYIALAIILSLMMGIIQLSFGVFKLGFLVNFLSKPVISGFTSAAALVIGFSQLQHVVGFKIKATQVTDIFLEIIANYNNINIFTLGVALAGILIIVFSKKIHRAIPGALIAVIAGILLVIGFNLESKGVRIIGDIPVGLPSFGVPKLDYKTLNDLFPIALTLSIIALMEAISVGKTIQTKHKNEYKIDNNQEMIGLGMSNIIGSFFACFPTTGGFSRTAVNDQAGANTNLAAIISASLIALTLLFFTPLFYSLPHAVLGAIVLVAVFGLIDLKLPVFLWKHKKQDFAMLIIAFIVTLTIGIKEGIGAGVLISILALIYRTSRPHIAVLGRLPNTDDFRNIKRFEEIEVRQDVLILRQDAQLYFANTDFFIDTVKEEIAKKGKDLKLVILHCGSISSVDSTALQALRDLIEELNNQEIGFYFSGLIGPVRDFFHTTGFTKEVGENHFFIDVQACLDYLDFGAKKNTKQMISQALQANTFKEREV